MIDKHGNSVKPAVVDGQPVFIVRGKRGNVLHNRSNGIPDPKTPKEVAALGVDLASLREDR